MKTMAQAVLENLIDSGVTLYPIGRKAANWEWISCEEAISELEALQQPKSCEGCVHLDRGRFCTLPASNHCIRDAEDYFKLKE